MKKLSPLVSIFVLFFVTTSAMASDPGLKIVFYDGIELRLDRSTITEARIEWTTERRYGARKTSPRYVVHFTLTKVAARLFSEQTKANINTPMKFVLDGRVISAPVLRDWFAGGKGIVTTPSKDDANAMLEAMEGRSL